MNYVSLVVSLLALAVSLVALFRKRPTRDDVLRVWASESVAYAEQSKAPGELKLRKALEYFEILDENDARYKFSRREARVAIEAALSAREASGPGGR